MKLFAVLACLSVAVHGAKFSNSGFTVQAGSTFDIKWIDASGPVSIELRNGNPADLQHVIVVANGLPPGPAGASDFEWSVPNTLPGAGPYALVITDSTGPNYSTQFPIAGVVVTAQSSSASAAFLPTSTTSVATSTQTTVTSGTTSTASSVVSSSSVTSGTSSKSTETPSSTSSSPSTTPTIPHSSAPVTLSSPLALVLLSAITMWFLH